MNMLARAPLSWNLSSNSRDGNEPENSKIIAFEFMVDIKRGKDTGILSRMISKSSSPSGICQSMKLISPLKQHPTIKLPKLY